MIHENSIQTTRTARYYSRKTDEKSVENLWILLHGYGQSAYHFLLNFKDFNPENSLLIAPEGLSKFYLKGNDGRVGASWMTKENRENEIEDQIHLLDNLIQEIDPKGNLKINFFGFSQGAAVACRWFQSTQRKVQNLVIWGAGLPIETNVSMAQKYEQCNTTFVLGDDDEYLHEERLKQFYQSLEGLNFRHNVINYKGGHRLEKMGFDLLKMELKIKNLV